MQLRRAELSPERPQFVAELEDDGLSVRETGQRFASWDRESCLDVVSVRVRFCQELVDVLGDIGGEADAHRPRSPGRRAGQSCREVDFKILLLAWGGAGRPDAFAGAGTNSEARKRSGR